MTTVFMGKSSEHWLSIYQLAVFDGKKPKSLFDLIYWRGPESPLDCLRVGLELIEARIHVDPAPFYKMLENFIHSSRSEVDQQKFGVSTK